MKILAAIFLLATSLSAQPLTAVGATPCLHSTKRHPYIAHRFMRLTGYPHGRPGYIVDHIIPLCACGPDATTNMQWQTVSDAAAKDILEREQCEAIRKARKK